MAIWKPAWLDALNSQRFFVGCSTHEGMKKTEKNICCLDCCTSICPHCVPSHRWHRLLQVRRYVYHDVVRMEDLEKLIDCSNVQSYIINNSKVVFLKKRPQNRQFKGSGNICTSCDRCLQEPYIHCSLRTCKTLQLSPDLFVPHDVEEETTNSTILESEEPVGSSDSENLSWQPCVEIAAATRRKRSGLYICGKSLSRVSDDDVATNINRRKGIPQRSPLC